MGGRAVATAVLALALVAGGAAACAEPSDDDLRTRSAEADAAYGRIIEALYGTPEQSVTATDRVDALLQQGIAECMRRAGFGYPTIPPQHLAAPIVVVGDLTSVAPLGADFRIAAYRRSVAEAADRTRRADTSPKTEAAYAAIGRCGSAVQTPESFAPSGREQLASELERMLVALEREPAAAAKLAAYGGCMRHAGFDASDYTQLYQLIEATFPDASAGWAELAADPRWAAAEDFEHRAAAADATCRAELHHHVMAAAQPVLAGFEARHAVALAALRRAWAEPPTGP
ncbi:hypothetical protein [Catellatospora tritici]|uniref:hypothetical protein n=1 Tax=Catellatospora tritici TaxID=2851566 RepID=UPI001C2D2276|nr:hypothetical protein [Catellatospora tritici]MBV1852906.1 hypothetical protein [Catellatospora tritici]